MSGGHGLGTAAAPFAIVFACLASPLLGADTERLQVGGGTIEISIVPTEPSVPRTSLVRWVERCARAVSSYFGRFPVDRVRLNIVTGRGGSIRNGTTWGGCPPRIRVYVGRETSEADFEKDWLLTHEMVHLSFPEMAPDHHWIEEGLATYVEPVARTRVGWLKPAELWRGLVDGLPQGIPRRSGGGLDGTRSWGQTYWGGALFWFLADVEVREKTGNRRGVEDALRGVLKAGGNIGVSWTLERALAAADRATGVNVLSDLYARMGPPSTDVDLDALWKRLGVVPRGGGVTFDDSSPLATIRRSITEGGSPVLDQGGLMLFRRMPVRAVLVVTASLATVAISGAAEKRPIAETDLFRFVWVADPQISPDGKRVAFVRVSVNKKKEGYDTAIWIVPADASEAPRPLTNGTDTNPRWSPDGTRLAFNRAVEKDGKLQPAQLWVLPLLGGEARALTELSKGAGAAAWSPDGTKVAFTSTTADKDLAKKDAPVEPGKEEERESDVRVITRAVYRLNGPGYLDATRPLHLWTVEAPVDGTLPKPRRVTSGGFAEDNPAWSPDGKRLYFTSNRAPEPYYAAPNADVFSVPAGGGEVEKAADIDGLIGDYALSPDGRRIACVGSLNGKPTRSYDQPDLFVAEVGASALPTNLTAAYDFDVDGGATGDQRSPRGAQPSAPVWAKDALIVKTSEKGRVHLQRVDLASKKVEPLTEGDEEVMSYSATQDASRFAMVVSTPTSIGDLFLLETATRERRRLTRFNEELFGELDLTAPEDLWYTSFDGKKIHALVQKPPRFDPAQRYPLILNIHGGPHAAYGYTFFHEVQWMAAKGYVVLYPNPRGSSAYGQDFGNVIQYRYPGDDYKDLMAGVDELIKRGLVDPKRLGVTGGSGGGVLTNWTITQTDRFAAAVSQRSISDWAGWWYTADFTLFTPRWFRGAPFEQAADFAARSAITHVGRVRTPLMLIEGEADWRTPASGGGEQMFRALKYLKKPTVMVRFPDESHELSRSGRPWHRVERLQHIVGWFDKYLLDHGGEAYEIP